MKWYFYQRQATCKTVVLWYVTCWQCTHLALCTDAIHTCMTKPQKARLHRLHLPLSKSACDCTFFFHHYNISVLCPGIPSVSNAWLLTSHAAVSPWPILLVLWLTLFVHKPVSVQEPLHEVSNHLPGALLITQKSLLKKSSPSFYAIYSELRIFNSVLLLFYSM